MVFSANGAVVRGGRVLTARFRHRERAPEQVPYQKWFLEHGFRDVRPARSFFEGQGDVTFAGPVALAGWGFRTTRSAHHELQEFFGRPVVSLRLCDPRFYHLDMALCVLDERTVAYYPPAFSAGTRCVLERLFPDAIRVREADAYSLGLNAVSDGHHVVLPVGAVGMHDLVRTRGFEPVPVDDLGVPQGRRGRPVLHVGVAMTRDLLTRVGLRGHRSVHGYCAPNYDPLPVTLTRAETARGSRTTAVTATSTSSRPTPR